MEIEKPIYIAVNKVYYEATYYTDSAYKMATFMWGRKLDEWIIIKSYTGGDDKVLKFTTSGINDIEKQLEQL